MRPPRPNPSRRIQALLALLALAVLATLPFHPKKVAAATTTANPDAACANCHAEISARYAQTPMARASGPALAGLSGISPGGFTHAESGITYRVSTPDGIPTLTFDRPAAPSLHGTRRLDYFIGSNHRGRTFLYQEPASHQWFEIPINFYSRRAAWDMAPAFDRVTRLPAPLPTDVGCLHCHATAVAAPLPQAPNAFAAAPFAQSGIGCAACHGDPAAHLASAGRAPILNPARLPVARRDSICLQCHLEGDATVYRPGTSLAAFRPGDDLADRAVYFVRASRAAGGGRASSQWEALLRSACRQAAGDRLTCTTCHDPHGSPPPAQRVAWFRARCVSCHNTPEIAVNHHPEQRDCATCHMPTRTTTDISHEQATDHNIQAHPAKTSTPKLLRTVEELLPVGNVPASARDFGLAYAQLAHSGNRATGERAQSLLKQAEASGADDATLHTELGFLDQQSGDPSAAAAEYLLALRLDPYDTTALGNLAVLRAATGQVAEARQLLRRLLAADPTRTAAALNLAFLDCSLGDPAAARALLLRTQAIDPDDPTLRTFLATGGYAGVRCSVAPAKEASPATR